MLLATNGSASISKVKWDFSRRFEIKDLGEESVILGLEIHQNRANRTLHLAQTSYTITLLERFGMQDCKAVATLMETASKLTLFPGSQDIAEDIPYRQTLGRLMYLMVGTRPDLAFVVGKLSQFCETPLKSHWMAVKRVLRYIAGTRDQGILYGASQGLGLVGYSDSDWGGCLENRKIDKR
eukprot:IDg21654t1